MSDKTKAVNLTEREIEILIQDHGNKLYNNEKDDYIDRIVYLNKRLKSFKKPDTEIKSDNSAAGWGTNNAQT